MPSTYTSYQSRIPYVMSLLEHRCDQVAEKAANKIVEKAKAAVPKDSRRLEEAIHAERTGLMEWTVFAGDEDAFYGHMVEYGTARGGPAQPFLMPAVAEVENEINTIGLEVMDGLG